MKPHPIQHPIFLVRAAGRSLAGLLLPALSLALVACSQKPLPDDSPSTDPSHSQSPRDAASPKPDAADAVDAAQPTASQAPSVPSDDGAVPDADASVNDAAVDPKDAALPDAATGDAADGAPDPVLESYFPLGDGYTWTYRHTSQTNGVWPEISTVTATEFEGNPAWRVEASPDLDGFVEVQIWQDRSGQVARVHREQFLESVLQESVDYTPGFPRFDVAWEDPDFSETVGYTRVSVDSAGMITSDTRDHVFTTLDVDATVTVDGKVYKHCLQVERHRDDKMETKQFWFARGVGKVKEFDPDSLSVEELIDHSR